MSQAELGLQPDASRYTLPRFLEDVVDRHRDRVAIRFEEETVRYGELFEAARAVAKGLAAAGVGKGAHVGLLLSNRPEWVVAAFGVSLVGGVVVPVNTFGTPEEIDTILRHSDASTLILQRSLLKHRFLDDLLDRHAELKDGRPGQVRCEALPALRRLFCVGLDEAEGAVETWDALLLGGKEIDDRIVEGLANSVAPADDGVMIYTSGTTAQPKGVLHRQRAAVIQSWRFAEHYGLGVEDVVWTAQPFFWTAGICMSLGATLAAGGTLVLQEVFDASKALDAIEREGATVIHAWPHQEKALADHPSAGARDLSRVSKVNFSSPLAPLCGIKNDEWGTHGSYGLSETFTLASAIPANAPAEDRERTSGRPLPGMDFRILDPETGETLAAGEEGEIAVKGLTLMRGYYKVESENVFDADGFFHTQDGGWLDAQGYLHWKGRLSNLVKTGGANVSPVEVESALTQYPGVRTALAVGVPHPSLGEALVLCAVRSGASSAKASEEELRAFLRERLAVYKVPRCVLFFEEQELAFTGNQKIQLGPLREAALRRLAEDEREIDGYRYSERDL